MRARARLTTWARHVKRDVVALWLARHDPRVPLHAKVLAVIVPGYALSPIDLIPDFIPALGYVDDALIVPLGILLVARSIPDAMMAEHRAAATALSEEPHSTAGAAVVISMWMAATVAAGWWSYRRARP